MAEKKLPRGVTTLKEVATKGGKGGAALRAYRRARLYDPSSYEHFRAIAEQYSDIGKKLRLGSKFHKAVQDISRNLGGRPRLDAPPTPRISDTELFEASKVRAAGKAGILAKKAGKLAGKLGAIGQIATLPSQIEEYKEMMKPLHKKEQERSARRM